MAGRPDFRLAPTDRLMAANDGPHPQSSPPLRRTRSSALRRAIYRTLLGVSALWTLFMFGEIAVMYAVAHFDPSGAGLQRLVGLTDVERAVLFTDWPDGAGVFFTNALVDRIVWWAPAAALLGALTWLARPFDA